MSSDKRTVTTDALETLGMILTENEKRDAIHLAVENAVAAHLLRAGEHVGFVEGGAGACDNPVGIVDPFLTVPVTKGSHFWLVVYPRQITSLRHVWTHPAFPEANVEVPSSISSAKEASEQWLKDFCSNADCPGFHAVMAKAEDFCDGNSDDEDYLFFFGQDAHGEIPTEFWMHFEIVTGKKPEGKAPEYFSCTC